MVRKALLVFFKQPREEQVNALIDRHVLQARMPHPQLSDERTQALHR